jgi:hypothetical protein
MTLVYFTIYAAMAVKVWFGKLQANQSFPEDGRQKLWLRGESQ